MNEIAAKRLAGQWITEPVSGQPADVIRRLVAVQSQDYYGARWAVGLRLKRATADDVDEAFDSGAILRTHMMRPTWHFVSPEDIRWMLMLTGPRVHALNGYRYRQLELDDQTLQRSSDLLAKALGGHRHLTRDALREMLEHHGISTEGQRMAYMLMFAELHAVICSGPRRGKQFTYALLDDLVANCKSLTRDEALAELAKRYVESRGPATVHDFAKWSGLTVDDARIGFESVAGQFERAELEGNEYWVSGSAQAPDPELPVAHLLSIYDEYISSYRDRGAIVSEEHAQKLVGQGAALAYVIVIDGRIVGTWKRNFKDDYVSVEATVFEDITIPQEIALAREAERYAEFHESSLTLNVRRST